MTVWRVLRRRWPLLVLFLGVATVSVSLVAFGEPRISPFDEATHADQAWRLAHGEVLVRGQPLSQVILDEWACRGFYDAEVELPPCGSGPYEPSEFPGRGLNYNWFHPPVYYAVTGVVARLVVAATPVDSFVTAARLVGIGWLAAGMLAVYALAREVGVRRGTSTAVALLLAVLPSVMHLTGTVNNDAATLVGGAAVVWVALRASRRQASLVAVGVVVALASMSKVVNGQAVVAAAAGLAVLAIAERSDRIEARRLVVAAVVMLLSFGATQGVWLVVQEARAGDREWTDPIGTGRPAEGVPAAPLIDNILDTIPPSASAYVPPSARGTAMSMWMRSSDLLLAAAPIAVGLAALRARDRWFGVLTIGGLMVGAVMSSVQFWVAKGGTIGALHPRYGLPLLPAVLVCLAVLLDRDRPTRVLAWVLPAVGALVVVPAFAL